MQVTWYRKGCFKRQDSLLSSMTTDRCQKTLGKDLSWLLGQPLELSGSQSERQAVEKNPQDWDLENGLDKNPWSSLDMCPQVVQLDSALKYLPFVLAETLGSFQVTELAEFHNGVFLEKRCTDFWQKKAELLLSLFCAHTYLWGLGRSNAGSEMMDFTIRWDSKRLIGHRITQLLLSHRIIKAEKKPTEII